MYGYIPAYQVDTHLYYKPVAQSSLLVRRAVFLYSWGRAPMEETRLCRPIPRSGCLHRAAKVGFSW